MFRHVSIRWLAFALVVLAATQAWAAAVHKGQGKSVGENKISILDKNGEAETFVLAKNAKITHDGKPAQLSDLDNGDTAKITTDVVDGKEVAVAIDAKSKE